MSLPQELTFAIEKELESFKFQEIAQARECLTNRYRSTHRPELITTQAQRGSYLATRLPATYAAVANVLSELLSQAPEATIESLLDLGAGPGTVMWAASALMPALQSISLIEKDRDLAAMGRRLAQYSSCQAVKEAAWTFADMGKVGTLPPHDLVTLSYALGELSPESAHALIPLLWNASSQFLVIIEPGTPAGFEKIKQARTQLIALGGFLVAPCPHALACPMENGDWCHFSQRIERSSLHRKIKGGTLGHEDEKFSYVIFSKTPFPLPQCRVLRHPIKRSGHIAFTLCTGEGIKQTIVSKRDADLYKQAKKWDWGSPCSLD